MISTKDYSLLPGRDKLKSVCKAISVLDAILSQDWEYRYYSYNKDWAEDEEFFEMRDGDGDQMLVLFRPDGCVINGYAHEFEQPDKAQLTNNLPAIFEEFIFGEPVNSVGTTFCLWTTEQRNWQTGEIENHDNNAEEFLTVFDGNPQTYTDWAVTYFDENTIDPSALLKLATAIYAGQTLNKAMVLSVVNQLDDWQLLKTDLDEIGYTYSF